MAASCNTSKLAMNMVADALSSAGAGGPEGSAFTRDDDPKLVGDAIPTFIKTMELIRDSVPEHEGINLSCASVITMYANAFVQDAAFYLPPEDVEARCEALDRAKRLYLRARDYAASVLERRHPGFVAALAGSERDAMLKKCVKADVPFIYWFSAASVAAFSADNFDFSLMLAIPNAMAAMERAYELDPFYPGIEGFLLSSWASLPESLGGRYERGKALYEEMRARKGGAGPGNDFAYAQSYLLAEGRRDEFVAALEAYLAIEPRDYPAETLALVIGQKRARWRLDNIDDVLPLDEGYQEE